MAEPTPKIVSDGAQPLSVLLLEDSDVDAELVIRHLQKAGLVCSIARTDDREEFLALLALGRPDVVLADYSLPSFDGLTALDLVRERYPDLPFIFVSGVVGEEFAINALRRGATDYVMKRGLNRLPAAVDRAIAEAREREERQRAERALRLSEASTQLAVEAAGLGKWEYDPRAHCFTWDGRSRNLLGLAADTDASSMPREDFLGRVHVDDRGRIPDAVDLACGNPGEPGSLRVAEEFRIVREVDREERWILFNGQGFCEAGICTRVIGVVADITERKRAETELQEINRTLKLRVARQRVEREHFWQLSQDLLAVVDLSGRVLEVNPAWQTTLGFDADHPLGRSLLELTHPDDAECTEQSLLRAASSSLRPPFDSRIRTEGGQYRNIAWAVAPGQGNLYLVGRDTTEDKLAAARLADAQDALRQAQKMEAVGQLTGGVAHDFNNLLQVVVGNIETLQRKMPADQERLRRAADHAMAGARRAANLTQRLLAFSRRQPLNPRPVIVNRLVAGLSDLLQRTLGELIEIETRLGPAVWPVEIDENQLESALLNLAVNARDAMPNGGRLVIETRNLPIPGAEPSTPFDATLAAGDYVGITVEDNGTGMEPEIVARAFEPFFTTKSVGQGTGLGLSQVYGFVKQSGGQVRIDSRLGQGTKVSLCLPRLTRVIVEEIAPVAVDRPTPVAKETVLVVEDDADVRAYTVETVRELGYSVLEARDGPSALKLLRQTSTGAIDLLFSDVVLPGGINGHELAQEAVRIHPGLKVLFATGYAHDVIVHHGRLDPGIELITKPFSFADLALKLRSVFDG